MKLELAESVVGVLRSGADAKTACLRLECFSEADWQKAGFWLDASGLALHLWAALSQNRLTEILPPSVRERLRQNSADNRSRSEAMFVRFACINAALDEAGIEYAALKGFSLAPDFCPDPSLRFQMDFDYLVRREAFGEVGNVLKKVGYSLWRAESFEAQFTDQPPDCRKHEHLYRPPVVYSLELHYSLFDREEFGFAAPDDSLAHRRRIEQFGKQYFVLDQAEQFLNRVLNAFQDILLFSVRLSSLLEVVHFIRRYRHDSELWLRLRRRADEWDPRIGAMIGLVIALAVEVFGCELPSELRTWTVAACPASALLWVRCYGLRWALHPFPGCKLSMLMARPFMDERHWRDYMRDNFAPLRLRHRLRKLTSGTAVVSSPPGQRLQWAWFHLREAFRVGYEIPIWAWTLRGHMIPIIPKSLRSSAASLSAR